MSSLSQATFDPNTLTEQVPPTALRYLTHAIRPGAMVARRAEVTFHGLVRLKPRLPWLSFRGQETIEAGRSFRVRARTALGPVLMSTRDEYEPGAAVTQVRLFGLLPVMQRHGTDVARSARGRLIVESTWLPSSFLPEFGAHWSEEGDLAQLSMLVEDQEVKMRMQLEADGLLRKLCLERWSRSLCTTAVSNPRQLTLRPYAQYQAIQAARERQTTPAFKER